MLRQDIDLRAAKLLPKLSRLPCDPEEPEVCLYKPAPPRVRSARSLRRRAKANQVVNKQAAYAPQYFRLKLLPSNPTKFLCSECSLAIERDAEFWGKKWQTGGEQLLKMLDEHATR